MSPNPQETAHLVTFTKEILIFIHFCAVYALQLRNYSDIFKVLNKGQVLQDTVTYYFYPFSNCL